MGKGASLNHQQALERIQSADTYRAAHKACFLYIGGLIRRISAHYRPVDSEAVRMRDFSRVP